MNKIIVGSILTTIMLAVSGCGQVGANKPIKIGWIGPLTKDAAAIGANTLVGAQVAVDEINARGGVNGRKIELVAEDTQCDPKMAATAMTKLASVDKVAAVIGGVCSGETLAAAPIAEQAHVPLISAGSSNPAITQAGDYTFRFYPSDSYQGKQAAEMVVNTWGKKKVALLYCESDYCLGIKNVFKDKLLELGGVITAEEAYTTDAIDLKTQLTKIKDSQPDLILFLGYTKGIVVGLKQIRELDIKADILGSDDWTDAAIRDSLNKYQLTARYLLPANQTLPSTFTAAMAKRTNGQEIIVSAPRAYDIAQILVGIISRVGTEGEKIKNELYKIKNYQGIADLYTMDANGDMSTANYEIKTN